MEKVRGSRAVVGKTAAGSPPEARRGSDVSGGSQTSGGEVGTFAWERWGIDTLLLIGAFIGGGLVLIVRWLSTRGPFSLSVATMLFAGAGIFFAIEASGPFKLTEFRGYDPVGKTGVVTGSGDGGACSVRVDGMEWSTRCKDGLVVGDEITVVGREGLHLAVQKTGRFAGPDLSP